MKTPPFFNIEFGDDDIRNLGKIYSAKIPNIVDIVDKANLTTLSSGDITQIANDSIKEDEKVPLVVINPVTIQKEDENSLTVNIIIDKVTVGFVSK